MRQQYSHRFQASLDDDAHVLVQLANLFETGAKGRSVQGVRRCSSLTKQRAIGEGKLAASEAAPVNPGEQDALARVADERIRTGLRQNERSGGV